MLFLDVYTCKNNRLGFEAFTHIEYLYRMGRSKLKKKKILNFRRKGNEIVTLVTF